MEECLVVNGRQLCVRVLWKSENARCLCSVLLYNTFYGRQCNCCSGLIKLACPECMSFCCCFSQ